VNYPLSKANGIAPTLFQTCLLNLSQTFNIPYYILNIGKQQNTTFITGEL